MAHTNVQLVSGNLTTGGEDPTFYVDRVNNMVGIGGVPDTSGDDSSNVLQITGSVLATKYHGDGSSLTGIENSQWLHNISDSTKIYYNGGNVGIGIDSPVAKLHVHYDTAQAGWRDFYVRPTSLWGDGLTTASETGGTKYMTTNNIMLQAPHITPASTGGNAYIRYGRAGGVQSGVWWETACITDGSFRIRREANDSYGIAIDTSGNLVASGDVTASSDRRLKTDIKRIEGALNKVRTLGGYTFTKNDNPSTGLIAQEVLEVLPEAVHGTEETYYSIAYGNMVGILIEAIKELSDEVKELKEKIG
jgi:hypothetical protein